MVTALLNIVSSDRLSPHTPMVAWDWLNRRPVLPPECVALLPKTEVSVVRTIQQLGGVELIVSYLDIVWSEKRGFWYNDIPVMRRLIREELGGIGAAGHRTDLIWRLDCVLLQLDQGQGVQWAKWGYEELRRELLKVDGEATKILAGTLSSCHPFFVY